MANQTKDKTVRKSDLAKKFPDFCEEDIDIMRREFLEKWRNVPKKDKNVLMRECLEKAHEVSESVNSLVAALLKQMETKDPDLLYLAALTTRDCHDASKEVNEAIMRIRRFSLRAADTQNVD